MDGEVIWVRSELEYFLMEDWTTQITLESLNKSSSDGVGYPVDDAMLAGSSPVSSGRALINCGDGNQEPTQQLLKN